MKFFETKTSDANELIDRISSPDVFDSYYNGKQLSQNEMDSIWNKNFAPVFPTFKSIIRIDKDNKIIKFIEKCRNTKEIYDYTSHGRDLNGPWNAKYTVVSCDFQTKWGKKRYEDNLIVDWKTNTPDKENRRYGALFIDVQGWGCGPCDDEGWEKGNTPEEDTEMVGYKDNILFAFFKEYFCAAWYAYNRRGGEYNKCVPRNNKELRDIILTTIDKEGPECDLNFIDVHKVDNMNELFMNTKFNGDISKWDVSNVFCMINMFANCPFNGDISKWDTRNLEEAQRMFKGSKFNGDISKWNVFNLEFLGEMFCNDKKFRGNLNKWNIRSLQGEHTIDAFKGSGLEKNPPSWYNETFKETDLAKKPYSWYDKDYTPSYNDTF